MSLRDRTNMQELHDVRTLSLAQV